MSHGDAVTELPKGFLELARSDTSPFQLLETILENFMVSNSIPKYFILKMEKKF